MSARQGFVLLVALLALGITLRAGFWQLQRATDKLAAQHSLQAQAAAKPLNNAGLLALAPLGHSPPKAESWRDRPVQLRGRWLSERTVWLDNRSMDGRAGFYVVTPLVLDEGAVPSQSEGEPAAKAVPSQALSVDKGDEPESGVEAERPTGLQAGHPTAQSSSEQLEGKGQAGAVTPSLHSAETACVPACIWVQRGWVARDVQDRYRLPEVSTPDDWVLLAGRLAPGLSARFVLGEEGVGVIRQNLDLAQMQALTDQRSLNLVVLQTDAPEGGLLRNWPSPGSGAEKNRGYAVQWFGMAALIAGLYVWFQLIKPFRRH